jgi:MoxR-like ATPase
MSKYCKPVMRNGVTYSSIECFENLIRQREDTTMKDKINKIRTELKNEFYERDEIIDSILMALLAKGHLLLLGDPGTAKSLLIQQVTSRIVNTEYFQWLVTRFTAPEEIFGPPDIKGLSEGKFERVTRAKLPEAHVAFVDEIFKANSSILNSFLTLLNERQFDNGTKRIDCPLVSCFGASNELPQDESLAALYDRFIFRFDVKYMVDGDNWAALMQERGNGTGKSRGKTTISLPDLELAQQESQKVRFPVAIIDQLREIKAKLEKEGIVASDRKWVQLIPVFKASAYLRGASEVEVDDLDILTNALWDEPQQRKVVRRIVFGETNPSYFEALEALDTAYDVFKGWSPNADPVATTEVAAKLRSNLEEVEKIFKILQQGNPNQKIVDQVGGVRRQVMAMYKKVTAKVL